MTGHYDSSVKLKILKEYNNARTSYIEFREKKNEQFEVPDCCLLLCGAGMNTGPL